MTDARQAERCRCGRIRAEHMHMKVAYGWVDACPPGNVVFVAAPKPLGNIKLGDTA